MTVSESASTSEANIALLREAHCPLCDSEIARHLFFDSARAVQRCAACNFIYVLPRPSEAEMKSLYSSDYFRGDDMLDATLDFRGPVFAQCLGALSKLAPGRGRLLDVGCWTGEFVAAAHGAGWSASGLEISTRAAGFAVANKQLDVRCCNLAGAPWPDETFDAITMLDVLEHVCEPLSELRKSHALLKPGGMLVVRVPNTIFHLAKTRICRRLKVRDVGLQTDYHLNHFTPKTLTAALTRVGFRVLSIEAGRPERIAFARWATPFAKRMYVEMATQLNRLTGIHLENITVAYARKAD